MVSLPSEILLNCVTQLSNDYREMTFGSEQDEIAGMQRTLRNRCLSSEILYTFAQPVLHQMFCKWYKMGEYTDEDCLPQKTGNHKYGRPARTEQFIRSLIQRPDLAAKVESLKLEDFQNDDEPHDFHASMLPFDPLLSDLFVRASMGIPPPPPDLIRQWPGDEEEVYGLQYWQDDWRGELQTGGRNAETALLFVLTTNLTRLKMEYLKHRFGPYVDDLWVEMLGPQSKQAASCRGVSLVVDAGF